MFNLKSYLQSGPLDVEFVSASGPFTKTSKAGKPYTSWTYRLRVRATGEEFEQFLFDMDHKKLGFINPGALIRIRADEKGYPQYSLLPTGEAALDVPSHNNSQQVATERRVSADHSEYEAEQAKRQKQISLAGVYQARLISGLSTDEAREAAVKDVAWLESSADALAKGLSPLPF